MEADQRAIEAKKQAKMMRLAQQMSAIGGDNSVMMLGYGEDLATTAQSDQQHLQAPDNQYQDDGFAVLGAPPQNPALMPPQKDEMDDLIEEFDDIL